MTGDGATRVECRGRRGQKNIKLTTIGVKWKNRGHRRPCRRSVSLQVEACRRKVNHAPTSWRVEEFAGEKIGVWRCVDHWLMLGFLPMGRLGPDALGGAVIDRR